MKILLLTRIIHVINYLLPRKESGQARTRQILLQDISKFKKVSNAVIVKENHSFNLV